MFGSRNKIVQLFCLVILFNTQGLYKEGKKTPPLNLPTKVNFFLFFLFFCFFAPNATT